MITEDKALIYYGHIRRTDSNHGNVTEVPWEGEGKDDPEGLGETKWTR